MVVWRITGDEIGPDGNGAAHFATKAEALAAMREYRAGRDESYADGPTKVVVKNRFQLASALDDAMGYGAT